MREKNTPISVYQSQGILINPMTQLQPRIPFVFLRILARDFCYTFFRNTHIHCRQQALSDRIHLCCADKYCTLTIALFSLPFITLPLITVQPMTKWITKRWPSRSWRVHFNRQCTQNERIASCAYWSTWTMKMLSDCWTCFIPAATHSSHFSRSICAHTWWELIWIISFAPNDCRTIMSSFWSIKFYEALSTSTVPESSTE